MSYYDVFRSSDLSKRDRAVALPYWESTEVIDVDIFSG